MKIIKLTIAILALGLFALGGTTVNAAPVTYYFAGKMDKPFGTISTGTPFWGSFTYNDAQPLNTPMFPYRGDYVFTNVSVTFGSTTVTNSGPGPINVYNNPGYPTDMFHLYTTSPSGSLGGLTLATGAGIQLNLQHLPGTVWNSPAIPGPGLTINSFTVGTFPSNATFLQLNEVVTTMSASARGELCALSNTPVTSCSLCTPPPTGMVAWYPFDEPVATPAAAEFINWNNGLTINGPTAVPGMVGNALGFDGVNDYVQSPNRAWLGPGVGDFSVDAWVRITIPVPPARLTIVDKRSGSGPTLKGYHFFSQLGTLGLQLADGLAAPGFTNYLAPPLTPPVTNGIWQHVAVTVQRNSPTGIKWYRNGVQFGTANPMVRTGSITNASPLRIGTQTAATPLSGWFKGSMDELEIFNRVLTPAEVMQIYNAGPAGKCKCK